jgi:hypothetical protein
MTSPLGLFVQVANLPPALEVKKWFDRIVRDYSQPGTAFYIPNLALEYIATKDADGSIVLAKDDQGNLYLDRIKDYLPHFGNVFVGSLWVDGVLDEDSRWANIYATRDAAKLFIQYMRDNNIAIPIHWYIEIEANLNDFTSSDVTNAYTWYIMQLTKDLTEISQNNGLNTPEFLWSPYWYKPFNQLAVDDPNLLINNIKSLLVNAPRLTWLHFQDGVGAHAGKHPDGTITYGMTATDAINYFHQILVPANSEGTLKSGIINMEYFVCVPGQDGSADCARGMYPGDPVEQEDRMAQYRQANIPVGVSWEVRWWYASLYETPPPPVTASSVFQNHALNNNNYELFVREGLRLRHYWYEFSATWNVGALFGSNVVEDHPVAFQNRAPNNYNYEVFVREGNRLRHHWFDYTNGTWNVGALFGSNVFGRPVAFQNRAPNNYNYEVFVREDSSLNHYWFDYTNGTWNFGSLIHSF